jgi:hypothetical protein
VGVYLQHGLANASAQVVTTLTFRTFGIHLDQPAFATSPANDRATPPRSGLVQLDFTEQSLPEVLEYMREVGKADVDFVILNPEEWELPQATDDTEGLMDRSVTLRLKQVTIAAALQALADLYNCAFVFRDYGILVLGPEQVIGMLDSYRAAGTPMIAPPLPVAPGVMSAMGMDMGGMPGMGGSYGVQAKPSEQAPAKE